MILTECTHCGVFKQIYYEVNDGSMGTAERWECLRCGTINYTEHSSMGTTYNEENFIKQAYEDLEQGKINQDEFLLKKYAWLNKK